MYGGAPKATPREGACLAGIVIFILLAVIIYCQLFRRIRWKRWYGLAVVPAYTVLAGVRVAFAFIDFTRPKSNVPPKQDAALAALDSASLVPLLLLLLAPLYRVKAPFTKTTPKIERWLYIALGSLYVLASAFTVAGSAIGNRVEDLERSTNSALLPVWQTGVILFVMVSLGHLAAVVREVFFVKGEDEPFKVHEGLFPLMLTPPFMAVRLTYAVATAFSVHSRDLPFSPWRDTMKGVWVNFSMAVIMDIVVSFLGTVSGYLVAR